MANEEDDGNLIKILRAADDAIAQKKSLEDCPVLEKVWQHTAVLAEDYGSVQEFMQEIENLPPEVKKRIAQKLEISPSEMGVLYKFLNDNYFTPMYNNPMSSITGGVLGLFAVAAPLANAYGLTSAVVAGSVAAVAVMARVGAHISSNLGNYIESIRDSYEDCENELVDQNLNDFVTAARRHYNYITKTKFPKSKSRPSLPPPPSED